MISTAFAQSAGSASGFSLGGLIPFILIFVIFYFLLIRPQQKKVKEHKNMVQNLKRGDSIVTAGGIVGKINKVEEDFVILQVNNEVEMRLQKTAVGATLPKGTIKSLDES